MSVSNYEAKLTTMITWGSNSAIYNLAILDVSVFVRVISLDASVTPSAFKDFIKF